MAIQVCQSARLSPKVCPTLTAGESQRVQKSGHQEAGTMDVDPLVVHALEKLASGWTRHVLALP